MRKKSKIITTKTGIQMKKLKNSDNAVVGIVAAFLIIGLVVAVLSVIQTQYVPKWMEEKEADHMNMLADQFAQLNYAISTHVLNEKTDIPISTTITLGSKEMPFLMSMRAFGELKILHDNVEISINGTPNKNIKIGTIKYSSYNNYFIDQSYIYECGGVILSQQSGNVMYIKPFFTANFLEDAILNFTIVNISTIGNKDTSVHGFGPAPIQTEFKNFNYSFIKDIKYINITTNYENSWLNFLNSTLIKAGLNYADQKNYTISANDGKISIHILDFPGNDEFKMHLTISKIGAQIAPGWVEDRQ